MTRSGWLTVEPTELLLFGHVKQAQDAHVHRQTEGRTEGQTVEKSSMPAWMIWLF